jgi:hypothetical protein
MPSNGHAAASPSAGGHNNRLDSWKEIAAYLHRSVRTVQRWEEELALPVHRLAGKKRDIVYAYPGELDAWLEAHSALLPPPTHAEQEEIKRNSAEPACVSLEPAVSAPAAQVATAWRARRVLLWVLPLVLAAVLAVVWGERARRARAPADFAVQGRELIVLDAEGKELWRHRFEFALTPDMRKAVGKGIFDIRRFQVADLDGDGAEEMLLVVVPMEAGKPTRLLCFSAGGGLLWQYLYTGARKYGQGSFPPPFNIFGFLLTSSYREGDFHIWAVSSHVPEFPSQVAKLDSAGRVVAEFWHPGHILALAEVRLDGRQVILAGGTHNEFLAATLAVLDYENPAGSAPATNFEYTCLDCPAGAPLAYFLFPRSQITRALDFRAATVGVTQRANMEIELKVYSGPAELDSRAVEVYKLDAAFRLLSAEVTDGYAAVFSFLRTRNLLRHPLDRKKEATALLTGVRYWDGKHFVPYSKREDVRADVSVAHALRPHSALLPK